MLVVKLEEHSPKTGKVTELGQLVIEECRIDDAYLDYSVALGPAGTDPKAILLHSDKRGSVHDHPRGGFVWQLVAKALRSVGFGRERGRREACE